MFRQNTSIKSKFKKVRFLIFVFLIFLILHFFKITTPIENTILSTANGLKTRIYASSIFLNSIFNEKETKETIDDLRRENIELMTKNAKLETLQAENKVLREHLNFLKEKKYEYIISNVISKNIVLDVREKNGDIVIDKGKKDGVGFGDVVLSKEGVVIGKINNVKDRISSVVLVSNNKCKLAAMLQNGTGVSGIVEGRLGLTMSMNFIPQTEDISIGDLIVTSGLEKNIPKGLLIGDVSQVKKESNKIWQSAVIDPIIDFDDILIVSILKSKNK